MGALNLRPYQLEGLEAIWAEIFKENTALCVMPTGSGKTETMIGLLQKCIEAKPDLKAVVLMGRIDLVKQTDRRFRASLGSNAIGVWCGSLQRKETKRPITIASIQSADAKKFPPINLIIIDEVHRLDQQHGGYRQFINHAIDQNARCKIIGFTATPFRASGMIFGDSQLFKRICFKKSMQEMIVLGFLVPPVLKASRNAFDVSQLKTRAGEYRAEDVDALVSNTDQCQDQVIDALGRLGGRQCVAWATANIDHCNVVANNLMAIGQSVATVHSKLDQSTRDANLAAFMTGQVRHVVFVSVLSEGFDHPPIDAIILMRPTRSPVLYVQTVGRGLRPYGGKTNCLVLDYGQVVSTLGPLDDPHIQGAGKGSISREQPLKCCLACMTYSPIGTRICPECGYVFPVAEPVQEKLDKKASETAVILSEKAAPTKETLGPVVISMHEAKSGNLCVKIHYQDRKSVYHWGGFGGVSEFFVCNSPWAMQRLERRLESLDISLPEIPFVEPVTIDGFFEVTKIIDGKYDRVLTVKKTEPETPDPLGGWGQIIEKIDG